MYNKQYNVYSHFSSNIISDVILVYEQLITLIKAAQQDENTKQHNLERSLDIVIKLLSSLDYSKDGVGKESLQAFYLLTVKRISKILYCSNDNLYDILINDIALVKDAWQELEDK